MCQTGVKVAVAIPLFGIQSTPRKLYMLSYPVVTVPVNMGVAEASATGCLKFLPEETEFVSAAWRTEVTATAVRAIEATRVVSFMVGFVGFGTGLSLGTSKSKRRAKFFLKPCNRVNLQTISANP